MEFIMINAFGYIIRSIHHWTTLHGRMGILTHVQSILHRSLPQTHVNSIGSSV